jgi:enterochelin esterase-like enzyme
LPKAPPKDFDQHHEGYAAGKLHTATYDSKTVGVKRKLLIFMPPGYTKSSKYPVLYLLHGVGGDQTDWTKQGAAEVILNNLYHDKKLAPMIVVMPDNRSSANTPPPDDKTKLNEEYRLFERELLDDVIPYVEANYPAVADRKSRALAGFSAGGAQALNFGLLNLDTFAWVGGFSASHTRDIKKLIPDPAATTKQLSLLWVSVGDKDPFWLDTNKTLEEDVVAMNIPHVWHVDSGAHEWKVWKADLYRFSQMIFR